MSTVDLRYARALLAVATERKLDPAALQAELIEFADALTLGTQLGEVLGDPSIPEAQKLRVIDGIAGKTGMTSTARNFIAVLVQHHRIDEVRDIVAAYGTLAEDASAIVEAKIVSAFPMEQSSRAMLEEQISRIMGAKKVRAIYSQDGALLGGAIVTVGSTVYDGSIRSQLEQLKTSLMEAGA